MFRIRWGNKYGNKRSDHNGVWYHSKLEAGYARELDLRLKAGEIKNWERQIKISFDINGFHITNYFCDFLVHHNDGSKEYVEVKGKFLMNDPVFVIKKRLMEAIFIHENKDCRYTIVCA